MVSIERLIAKLPKFTEPRMLSNGFGLWLAWRSEINPAVHQTLLDYGGLSISQGRDQSYWFFFSTDVILALARLEIWARLNPIPVFVQVVPARLLLGLKLEMSIAMEASLKEQVAEVGNEFEVWIHPKVAEMVKSIPGISFKVERPDGKLANLDWHVLQADPRLPYQSSLGWFMVLKPLGNPLDKRFQSGWREFFSYIERIFRRMKLKYLIHDFFLIFPLENLRQLRTWCQEFLTLVKTIREDNPEKYWPCVLAVKDKKGLNFNTELPKKVALDWEQLMPDFPHMSYRNALLIGEEFRINDVRFSMDENNVEDWCNISLIGDKAREAGSLLIELPKHLVAGKEGTCFYCGLHNHASASCPSKQLDELDPEVWNEVANLDFDKMRQAFDGMDEVFSKQPALDALNALLRARGTEGVMMRAYYEINSSMQLRMASILFRTMGKEYPRALKQLGPTSSEGGWDAFELLLSGENQQADRMLTSHALKYPRSYQVRIQQGFLAVEKDDMVKAGNLFKEAGALCATQILQSYCLYLQGRVLEVTGKYPQAVNMYKQAMLLSPLWREGLYRQGVCQVKMGFAEQAMMLFNEVMSKDLNTFNRILIDAELERGHIHLLAFMYDPWAYAESKAREEHEKLDELRGEVNKWFPADHYYCEEFERQIVQLSGLSKVKNFVAFNKLAQGRSTLGRKLMSKVEEEGLKLRGRFERIKDRLKEVRNEAAWFPFPKILVDFNKDFNYCARNLNWAARQHFQLPENFRRAQDMISKVEDRTYTLEDKLKTLKVVRDATLFLLIMGKGFFWMEIVGMILTLLLLPIAIYYGKGMGYDWASNLAARQKWEIQQGMILILSVCALGLATLRAAIVFERKKLKLFKKLEEEEERRGRELAKKR